MRDYSMTFRWYCIVVTPCNTMVYTFASFMQFVCMICMQVLYMMLLVVDYVGANYVDNIRTYILSASVLSNILLLHVD